jgi:protein O-GlcNAc transferase
VPPTDPGQFLAEYGRLDIGLDPFPYNGGTTTCEALWMGVPVVTLAGERFCARMGLSLLENVGLPELVARTADDYVRIAQELAGDLPRLAALRASLRARMASSPICDAPRAARELERAYCAMWDAWLDVKGNGQD